MEDCLDQPEDPLAGAWRSLDAAKDDLRAKRPLAKLLRLHPQLVSRERAADLRRLVSDPDIDPADVASAGWSLVLAELQDDDPAAMARAIESDALALSLLTETCVFLPDAERAMSGVRRWLLLSRKSRDYPRLTRALVAQAAWNGGAWPFDEEERAALKTSAFAAAYLPERPPLPEPAQFGDAVTDAIADQYVRWPYPEWSRVTVPEASTVPAEVERMDGGRPSGLPVRSEILVAGCGTGREPALLARRFPDAHITAIDLSERSLAYAAHRCNGLDIDFQLLDLHDVGRLGRRFHFIACSGVLHHLPDPEAGWAKLVAALEPGGIMKVMVYSRVARLRVDAARARIADLRNRPVDDDLLREVRRRLIEASPPFVADFIDFYSLGGVHDLLLNRREDPFDVPRIARALERLRLELLAFKLPTKAVEAEYRRDHPDDPMSRNVQAWGSLEKSNPLLFSEMYEFWCRAAS
jgi:SAM-dependent methyltransferase